MSLIQIAPLKKDFQRIIDFDRIHPAKKIVVFVSKADTIKGTTNYAFLEKTLNKLREYCQLTKIQFNMQVIDITKEKDFLNVILDFAKALIMDYQPGHEYMLNLGDTSLVMNISLIQAAQIVKSLYNMEIKVFVSKELDNQEIIFEQNLVKSFEALVTEPVSMALLNCISEGNNLDQIKDIMQISLGTASNYLKQLKELGLIEVSGHSRSLTDLGQIVKQILTLRDSTV
ncbi:MAG: hypothetical protein FK734_06095 [Asgard group archaeon]|nr:hypothetical protein [Asgard group archaeon]